MSTTVERRVRVDDGIELYVRERRPSETGDDGRDLLLVHGLSSNARLWGGVATMLSAAGHRSVAVDLRSHGRSDGSDDLTHERIVADLVAVIARTGLERPIAVGQSWGGNVVLELAATRPASVGGVVAIPVYELYKVGEAPHWREGLDLMRTIGLDVVVVPHYDNAEGGTHDTSCCYIGDRRLRTLEAELAEGMWILGIDEHTAAVIDLSTRVLRVEGRGRVVARAVGNGDLIGAAEVTAALLSAGGGPEVHELAVSQLATLARIAQAGMHEHRHLVAPHVETLLALRRTAREERRFADADLIRDALVAAGVEVRDGDGETRWEFTDPLDGVRSTVDGGHGAGG